MKTRLAAVLAGELMAVNVSAVCAELGISRDTFYRYKRRFDAEGPPGLADRSRRPHCSPNQTPAELEETVVRLRKELPLYNGAQTIVYALSRLGLSSPSMATIHRILVRRGLVVPEPAKRPRSSWRRFEWPRPNDVWQIDATAWAMLGGEEVWIMDVLDDHSRLSVAARVWDGPTVDAAWDALCWGAHEWGLPARVLSDNGRCFTTATFTTVTSGPGGGECDFERSLRCLGIRQMHSAPYHPQTCGKIERFHQTLKKWLRARPLAATPAELQAQLDAFRCFYNHERPHRALRGATPSERWAAQPASVPAEPIDLPPAAEWRRVDAHGKLGWGGCQIAVGQRNAGRSLLVIARANDLAIFERGGLVRRLTIINGRRYQPNGRRPGRPPKHP